MVNLVVKVTACVSASYPHLFSIVIGQLITVKAAHVMDTFLKTIKRVKNAAPIQLIKAAV